MKRFERPILIIIGEYKGSIGYFHKWGISKDSFVNENGKLVSISVTKAIIELESGDIIESLPKEIKFTDASK
jgi:hypothetical protein